MRGHGGVVEGFVGGVGDGDFVHDEFGQFAPDQGRGFVDGDFAVDFFEVDVLVVGGAVVGVGGWWGRGIGVFLVLVFGVGFFACCGGTAGAAGGFGHCRILWIQSSLLVACGMSQRQ